MSRPRTILITGCSEGGLGDALARALHQHGQYVIATARSLNKIAHLEEMGIDTLILDVVSSESVSACVAALADKTGGSLDMLINNSGNGYSMPLVDSDLDTSRQLFEVNVWGMLAVTQAFLPLLLQSDMGGVVVNNTSINSVLPIPMSGIYNASKAAAAMMTDTLRLELAPFDIKVVDLKTGAVTSNFYENRQGGAKPVLPKASLYNVAKEDVEGILHGSHTKRLKIDTDEWALQVVKELLKTSPPSQIWKGGNALSAFFSTFLPSAIISHVLSKVGALDMVKKKWNAEGGSHSRNP
ncbi:hypothetical protein BGZ61DRAFT_461633 [Ilyonectria robusta]|uniref:uncharacterized protein n=1 Tax=Ilyonectria robusta TaxID=1079257 RepID=UPI001E8CA91B|nr:uncharacterized protein BGZ61DRAFT_461633 [Ilyonectria robusta]KAH8666122.1 hypothetical protein BGZ61DRAFT_461633 [Ilyonectria robusta]